MAVKIICMKFLQPRLPDVSGAAAIIIKTAWINLHANTPNPDLHSMLYLVVMPNVTAFFYGFHISNPFVRSFCHWYCSLRSRRLSQLLLLR